MKNVVRKERVGIAEFHMMDAVIEHEQYKVSRKITVRI